MTSTKSRSNALSYFLFRTGRNRVMWIILMILNLLGFPLTFTSLNLLYDPVREDYPELMTAIIVISAISLIIAVIISLFVVYNAFDYLTKKVMGDMIYSAPITNNERFLADWFSGLFTAVSPFVIGILIGYIPALMMRGKVLASEDYNTAIYIYTQLAVAIIIALIMAYAIGAFVTMCCGAKLEAIGYSIVCHAIVPITIFVTMYSAFRYFTMSSLVAVDEICLKWIAPTSPIGILINLMTSRFETYYDDGIGRYTNLGIVKIFSFEFLFTSILIIVLLFALTMFLNTKRKAEKCGNPFVFKGLYYACMSLMVYCAVIVSVANRDITTTVVLIFLAVVVYMLLEVLKNRGFKRIWVGALRLIGTLAVSAVLAFGIVKIGTTINNKVPSVDEVKSVTFDYVIPGENRNIKVEITDKEIISKILSIHQEKVENLNKNDYENVNLYHSVNYDSYSSGGDIVYKLNNGFEIKREIYLNCEQTIELKDILATETYKQSYLNKLKNIKVLYDDNIMYMYHIGGCYSVETDATELINAYIKDVESLDAKQLQIPSERYICSFSLVSQYVYIKHEFPVYANYKNTIEFLLGDGSFDSDYISDDIVNSYKYRYSYDLENSDLYIISPDVQDCTRTEEYDETDESWKYEYETVGTTVLSRMANLQFDSDDFGRAFTSSNKFISKITYYPSVDSYGQPIPEDKAQYNEKIRKLVCNAIPYGISDKPLYSISINGTTYLIPEEYSEIAKEVMEEGRTVEDYLIISESNNEYYDYTGIDN